MWFPILYRWTTERHFSTKPHWIGIILALLSITFLGTGGFLVIRYKLFKMAVCQEITTVTLNLFLIFSACLVNDINIFDYTVLLLALIAAETAMALSLIIGSRGLSGRLSVRNNVSNYSTYLPKCQRLLSGPLGLRHPSGAVSRVGRRFRFILGRHAFHRQHGSILSF